MARASIGAIPFADASMDVATSFDVFQCLPDPIERDALQEMWRVLKPGGHLILNVAALDILRGEHAALSEEVRRYTPARLRQVVEAQRLRHRPADVCACEPVSDHAAGSDLAALARRLDGRAR